MGTLRQLSEVSIVVRETLPSPVYERWKIIDSADLEEIVGVVFGLERVPDRLGQGVVVTRIQVKPKPPVRSVRREIAQHSRPALCGRRFYTDCSVENPFLATLCEKPMTDAGPGPLIKRVRANQTASNNADKFVWDHQRFTMITLLVKFLLL
jgi:hypothetical protein